MTRRSRSQKGFTLVELLVVVALIAVTAGVASDIVLSLIRSYSKTKVSNEIEQSANAAMLKMEKELKTATGVPAGLGTSSEFSFLRDIEGTSRRITYRVSNGMLERRECPSSSTCNTPFVGVLTTGNNVYISNSTNFNVIQTNPVVLQMKFTFSQGSDSDPTPFSGVVTVEQTVVMRGTYE